MKRLCVFVALLLAVASPAAAEISVKVLPGGWNDIVKSRSGFDLIRATDAEVVRERVDGVVVWRTPLPEPILYLRAAIDPDNDIVKAIAQGHQSGLAYVITQFGVTAVGPSFGQNATAIAWLPGRGFVLYVQTSPTTYEVRDGTGCAPCQVVIAQTSQGFRDIQPDGEVRLGDSFFTGVFNGRRLWEFAQRGNVTVGQCDPPGICAATVGRTFTVLRGDAFEPRLADGGGGTFAVSARTGGGVALAIVRPPYPPDDVVTPPPAPPPLPIPSPTPVPPTPAPNPPSCAATFKAAVEAQAPMLEQLRALAKQGDTTGWSPELQSQHPALRARLTRIGAYACWQTDRAWGLLRKDGGSRSAEPIPDAKGEPRFYATDILVYRPTMALVDVFGDYDPQWGPLDMSLDYNKRTPDFWLQPLPEDRSTPTPPAPVDPPASDPRVAELQRQLDGANATIAQLQRQLADAAAAAAVKDQQVLTAQAERDQARAERDALKNRPTPSCEAKVPGWLKASGIKVGCRVIEP